MDDDRLIGRDSEIALLKARLASGEPGLVVIDGEPSIGKGRLLKELRAWAADRHRVVPADPAPHNGPDDVPAGPAVPAEAWLSVSKKTTVAAFKAAVKGVTKGAPGRAADTGEFGILEAAPGPGGRAERPLTLVLVHGYDPTAAFAEWFTGDFVHGMAAKRRLLVVVAGTAVDTAPLKEIDGISLSLLRLGPLPRADVLAWLRALDAEIRDKLSAREVEVYADAITSEPSLMGAFSRLLPLTSGGGAVPSGGALPSGGAVSSGGAQ